MRKIRSVVALMACFIMVTGLMVFNLPETKAAAAPEPNDTWRQVDPTEVKIGKSYLIVSEHGALVNAQAIINTPGDVTGDTNIGMASKPVTIEDGFVTSEVTDDMIWQFGLGANNAAASGGLGEGNGYYVLNNAPGAGGGTEPLRRESSFNAQHAPLNTVGAAINGNQQSMLLHVLDEAEGTVSMYIWGGNNQWNFALTSTVDGFIAKSKAANTTSAAQLLQQMQESPSLRLYEPNVTVGTQHYVMASSGENGSISPSSLAGHVWVNDGDDVTFTLQPAFGFEVNKVMVNGVEVAVTDNTYTIENVTSSDTKIHVTFKPVTNAADLPFTVYNDIFSVGNVTTAVIIDLGDDNAANLADLSADMFKAAAVNTRLDGSTMIFDGLRKITRVYVNNDPEPLGYISPAPGTDNLVTDMPLSGRYIIVEFEFWNANGYTSGAMVSGNLQNAFSTLLNYRVNVDREIRLTDGSTITPRFTQAAVVNPALDKFVSDKTNPGETNNMDILISIDESWEDNGPLPLFIYNHGGGRGGPSGDYFAPMQTANGAAVLSKLQLDNPGKYNAHIIATQNHTNNQANNEALMAYVEGLAAEGKVDLSRIYMSGFSMGSMYTIGFYERNPEFLAAIVPLAGGTLPSVVQLTANPELTKTSIWAHTHKNDGAGNSWTSYFTTGAGASGLYLEANVNVLETNQAFNFPYYGFDWTPHETEAQVYSNLLGQSNASFRYGPSQEEYADKNIFDWMFDQNRNSTTSSATLSGPALVQFGDTFDVTYGLESLKQEVYAQDITIEYDADKLELIGEPMSVDTEKFVIVETDKQEGIIRILGIHLNESANNPNQDFIKLSFKAKTTAGIANIEVTQLLLADGEGVEGNIDGNTHSVEIRKPVVPGDVNDDDRVSVGDLALLAKAYGKSSSSPDWNLVKQYDLNKDGTIDIEDLVQLARLILNK